jgi:hypothetical protein
MMVVLLVCCVAFCFAMWLFVCVCVWLARKARWYLGGCAFMSNHEAVMQSDKQSE